MTLTSDEIDLPVEVGDNVIPQIPDVGPCNVIVMVL